MPQHWDTPTRTRVRTLIEDGHSQRDVSRITGVSQTSISRWLHTQQGMRRNHSRSGRPPKLSKHDIRRLIGIVRSGWEGRKLSWRKLANESGLNVSAETVRTALGRRGYRRCKACKKPFINRQTQYARKIYARIHLHKPLEFWRSHMYADECSFHTSTPGRTYVTRLPNERYHDHCMEHSLRSGRSSVMIWAAISYNWKSPLVFLVGTGKRGVVANDYFEQVLKPIVGPAFHGSWDYESHKARFEEDEEWGSYVEDHAPVHGTKKSLVEAKRALEIPLHDRPAASPDLNPIENVWRLIKQRIKQRSRFPATLTEMKKAVQEEWDGLQPSDWNKYIDSMPERIRQLHQRKGMQTQY